jgi:hypothetical protein
MVVGNAGLEGNKHSAGTARSSVLVLILAEAAEVFRHGVLIA